MMMISFFTEIFYNTAVCDTTAEQTIIIIIVCLILLIYILQTTRHFNLYLTILEIKASLFFLEIMYEILTNQRTYLFNYEGLQKKKKNGVETFFFRLNHLDTAPF